MSVIRDTAFAKSLLGTPLSNNIFSAESSSKFTFVFNSLGAMTSVISPLRLSELSFSFTSAISPR